MTWNFRVRLFNNNNTNKVYTSLSERCSQSRMFITVQHKSHRQCREYELSGIIRALKFSLHAYRIPHVLVVDTDNYHLSLIGFGQNAAKCIFILHSMLPVLYIHCLNTHVCKVFIKI